MLIQLYLLLGKRKIFPVGNNKFENLSRTSSFCDNRDDSQNCLLVVGSAISVFAEFYFGIDYLFQEIFVVS